MALLTIEERRAPGKRTQPLESIALFRLGFRPFYLLAAAFAAISVPLWIACYYGWVSIHLNVNMAWHAHEMIFGFAVAVIIGFLYTAGRNWTGLWTPRGGRLAAIAGLWLAGRATMLAAPPLIAALVDAAFLPAAAWPLYRVLKRAGNKRNMFLVALLALLALANAAYHASMLGLLNLSPLQPVYAAIMIIVAIESVIGGRVIPGFTRNAVPGSDPVVNERRDRISMAFTAAACAVWIAGVSAPLSAALALAAACAQLTRLIGWKPFCSIRNPLLWILHLSYAWIPVGFLLLALAALGVVSSSAAIHVLAVGSMAGLIIGMITRTALGHTGRALKAGAWEVAMYALVQIGVIARFLAATDAGGRRDLALLATAVCWTTAFLLYIAIYGRYLLSPRIDGMDG